MSLKGGEIFWKGSSIGRAGTAVKRSLILRAWAGFFKGRGLRHRECRVEGLRRHCRVHARGGGTARHGPERPLVRLAQPMIIQAHQGIEPFAIAVDKVDRFKALTVLFCYSGLCTTPRISCLGPTPATNAGVFYAGKLFDAKPFALNGFQNPPIPSIGSSPTIRCSYLGSLIPQFLADGQPGTPV